MAFKAGTRLLAESCVQERRIHGREPPDQLWLSSMVVMSKHNA